MRSMTGWLARQSLEPISSFARTRGRLRARNQRFLRTYDLTARHQNRAARSENNSEPISASWRSLRATLAGNLA